MTAKVGVPGAMMGDTMSVGGGSSAGRFSEMGVVLDGSPTVRPDSCFILGSRREKKSRRERDMECGIFHRTFVFFNQGSKAEKPFANWPFGYHLRDVDKLILILWLFIVPWSWAIESRDQKVCIILGDSLTAGYGLSAPDEEAFPARLQELCIRSGLGWRIQAAGVSGDTTAGGLRRIDWLLRRPTHGVLIALGGNDGLRGIPPAETASNLKGIIAKVRAKYPDAMVWLAGMQMPPNLGSDYLRAYKAVFGTVASETGVAFIPFLLEGVGGVTELNQTDGIHPNAEGHRKMALLVWRAIEGALRAGITSGGAGDGSSRQKVP